MAKRYHFGAVRLLGLAAVLYGVTGIITDLSFYYDFADFEFSAFVECLQDMYFMTSLGMIQFAYYVLFTVFGLVYMFNTKPSMRKAGFNPKAYAMIGFAFLFTLHNMVYFMIYYPFDFTIPEEFTVDVIETYIMNIYCSVGEVLMIAALINYLRGGKVIRSFLFISYVMAFALAVATGLVGIEALIDAVEASQGGFNEVSELVFNVSFVVITFFLMMFSFSHDRILRKRPKQVPEMED